MDMYVPALQRRRSDARAAPDGGVQVAADRLSIGRDRRRHAGRGAAPGGDQFLIKPFNPVLLAAVVKTKIERFRETQRSTRIDGLTGLLNHTAAKSQLKTMPGHAGYRVTGEVAHRRDD